jgi:hypothetical protein
MKRPGVILLAGLAAAALGYCALYRLCTADARQMAHSETPELAWLKAEFHLSDAEFERIAALHESYLQGCAERCRLIDEKNAALRAMLARTNTVTPEIQKALADAALLRADCQRQMLQHFYEVSRSMPPEQGRRYLAWVQARTLHTDTHRTMH